MNKDQALSSSGRSPDGPGWSSAGRGQQLGGRSQPRAARRRPARGDIRFECGATDSHSSLPVPDPAATVNLGRSCGEWVCAGWGRCGGPPRPCPRKESRGRPWVSERKGTQSLDGPGTRVGGDLRTRCSAAPPSSAGSPGRPGGSPPSPGLLQPTPCAQLSAPRLRLAARVPHQPPTARLPGPRPAPAIGQGAPPADADPACVVPVAPAEPRAAAAQIRAPAVEDRGSGSGSGVGEGRPGARGRGRPAHLTVGAQRPRARHGRRALCKSGCAQAP